MHSFIDSVCERRRRGRFAMRLGGGRPDARAVARKRRQKASAMPDHKQPPDSLGDTRPASQFKSPKPFAAFSPPRRDKSFRARRSSASPARASVALAAAQSIPNIARNTTRRAAASARKPRRRQRGQQSKRQSLSPKLAASSPKWRRGRARKPRLRYDGMPHRQQGVRRR